MGVPPQEPHRRGLDVRNGRVGEQKASDFVNVIPGIVHDEEVRKALARDASYGFTTG